MVGVHWHAFDAVNDLLLQKTLLGRSEPSRYFYTVQPPLGRNRTREYTLQWKRV